MIYFDLESQNPYLYIKDDGFGMSLKKLKEAAVIGFQSINDIRSEDDLGRFSTGLKSAAKSFSNNMVICSKVKGERCNIIQIDFKHIAESNKWEAYELDNFFLSNLIGENGTIIYCDNLTLFDNTNRIEDIYTQFDKLEKALSHIFGKFILEDKLNIEIQTKNSLPLHINGWNPFGLINSKSTKKVYEENILYKGSNIQIKAYVLPVFNNLDTVDQNYMKGKGLLEQQGFYIYRNKRLISEGGWLNLEKIQLDDKSKYARIEVMISSALDEEFKVNFSKNSLFIPNELKAKFEGIAKKTRNESRNSFNYQTNKGLVQVKRKKDEVKIWQLSHSSSAGSLLTINIDHPIICELCSEMSKTKVKKLLSILSKTIPVNLIQNQNIYTDGYTDNEIIELIDEMYNKLKQENLSLKEIKLKMGKMEPFKEKIDILIDYFDKLEENNE